MSHRFIAVAFSHNGRHIVVTVAVVQSPLNKKGVITDGWTGSRCFYRETFLTGGARRVGDGSAAIPEPVLTEEFFSLIASVKKTHPLYPS